MVAQCLLAAALSGAMSATNDWENPAVNSINRLPARTYAMPLGDESAAFTDALEPETPFKLSLNGKWRFAWAGRPQDRVRDFWQEGFDDSRWFEIDVPSCVELKGFGSPGYVNVRYPHANQWPKILDRDTEAPDYNPVSSYRRTFRVPASWQGRRVILRFDGVGSAFTVWVNGKRAGYAEDSKLPSEFDVTPLVRSEPTELNTLAVEVFRWCDGSYLEDQDMFRYSGIFRDVTLWSMPKDGIWDFVVRTSVDGRIEVEVEKKVEKVGGGGDEQRMQLSLYDADKQKVGDLTPLSTSTSTSNLKSQISNLNFSTSTSNLEPQISNFKFSTSTYFLHLDNPRLWSAETPYLYTLVIKQGGDIRMKRVGFKEQKIVGNTFLVNGRKVKFKGVNRHETSPETGRTVSLAEMVKDVTMMKRYNFNTVRTSHYPNHHLWYDLCDRYGLYVVAEANVEGHEPGYEEGSLGRFPEWDHTIVERNERNAVFYRNHPSVTMWSMGNETGHGPCFTHAIAAVRKLDPTRPIHWERGNAEADVDSTMYPDVNWLEHRGQLGDQTEGTLKSADGGVGFCGSAHSAGKCFFLCEYAHAMGNAVGNFAEYWEVFYRYDSLSGGCIWDWVDQAIWKTTDRLDPKTGLPERFLAYGGDFDEEPNDGPFCVNGLVGPLRKVTPKLLEVAHVQRNLVVRETNGVYTLENRFSFLAADRFAGRWELISDGRKIASAAFEVPAIAPLSTGVLELPEIRSAVVAAPRGTELFVNFAFSTKADTCWARAGSVIARDQFCVRAAAAAPSPRARAELSLRQDGGRIAVAAENARAVFSEKTGELLQLELAGVKVVENAAEGLGYGAALTCARAFVDNDCYLRDGDFWSVDRRKSFYASGLTQLRYHARPFEVRENSLRLVVEVTGSKSAGFTHEQTWAFGRDGSVTVENRVTPHGVMPPALPRLGLSFRLRPGLNNLSWYGRGPQENYIDRKTAAFVGLWQAGVDEQFVDYVRPQDNGYKCDVRQLSLTDADGRGVRISQSEPFFFQALRYTREDLEFARHRSGERRHRTPLVAHPEVFLNLDVRQLGLGGASCGPKPMDKYFFDPHAPVAWSVTFEPVARPLRGEGVF